MIELAVSTLVAFLAAGGLSGLAALVERTGPIRLRHWAEESGPDLRALYGRPRSFEVFRFLVSLSARLALVALFSVVTILAESMGSSRALAWGFGAAAFTVSLAEIANRFLVARASDVALRRATPFFRAIYWILRPVIPLLVPIVPGLLTQSDDAEDVTREEIEAFIDVGRREGILEAGEGELVRGVVDFGDTQVRSVMTPRVDMVCAPVETTTDDLARLVLDSGHSRIPLYQDSIDQVVGILHVRDLLRVLRDPDRETLRDYLQPTHFVPETKSLAQLLGELQERHQELAIVVDEYGGTEGLVTIEDLLEEIFGEIADEHDEEEPEEVKLPDGSWRLEGRTDLQDLEEIFGVEVDEDSYETVGGLVFGILGHVPRVGDSVRALGLKFLVEGADHRRARWVRISKQSDDERPSREGPES